MDLSSLPPPSVYVDGQCIQNPPLRGHNARTLSLIIKDQPLFITDQNKKVLSAKVIELRSGDTTIQPCLARAFLTPNQKEKQPSRFGIPQPELYGRIKLYREKEGELEDWTALLTDTVQQVLFATLLDRGPLERDLCAASHQVPPGGQCTLQGIPLDSLDGPRPGEWLALSSPRYSPRAVLHLKEGLCLLHLFQGCPIIAPLSHLREEFELLHTHRLVRKIGAPPEALRNPITYKGRRM